MADTGASAALKGYRLQALYTLHRILSDEAGQLVFRLEGHEDLDILDANGQFLEIIQLKAYGEALTLSELKPRKPDSFFHRVLKRRDFFPNARERIVSFGPYGPEMLRAWSGLESYRRRVVQQFETWGYTSAQAESLLATVTLDSASERELTETVFEALRESFVGYDTSAAFDLLHAWLFQAAESRETVTQQDLREHLTNVSRFLADRAAYHAEWFTAIVPLEESSGTDAKELGEEFYQGVSARYEHILAGVDVVRRERLDAIEQAFSKARVVVVRGASGQGKSALAHRFLHDYVPSASRFKVRLIQDRRHALSIARALTGHLSVIGALTYIHVEVAPGDTAWTELVDGLYEQRSARILVTIREEDWLRASISRSNLRFEEIALQLDEAEARLIHGRLIQRRPSPQHLDFEESWARFGGRGPLLEFTYLITQHDTLRARLEAQVLKFRERAAQLELRAEAELELLRRVSVASAYGARLNVILLARSLGLSEPLLTIQRLEREYLVRTDASGHFVGGLHPVRSTILVSLLTDTTFNPWVEVAVRALPQIVEVELGVFLLHAFSRHESDRSRLAREFGAMRPSTWTGTAQVFRALIWLGLSEYIARNESVIAAAKASFGAGWFVFLPIDAGEVQAVSPGLSFTALDSLDFIPDEARQVMRDLRARLTPSRQLFTSAREWLASVDGGIAPPADSEGWAAVAECIFWAARLGVTLPGEQGLLDAYEAMLDTLPLGVAADVAYALSFHSHAQVHDRLSRLRPEAIVRMRRESQIFKLEQDDLRISAHFLMDPAFIVSSQSERVIPKPLSLTEELSPNREAVRRAQLLRSLLPGRRTYATQGYGHRSSVMVMEHDETTKEMDANYLPPEWATRLNGMLTNLVIYPDRPRTWAEHAAEVLRLRQFIVEAFEIIRGTLESHFRGVTARPLVGGTGPLDAAKWDELCKRVSHIPLLPRVAVDEWGFTSEQSAEFGAGTATAMLGAKSFQQSLPVALMRHNAYRDVLGTYARSAWNFMSQVTMPLAIQPFFARGSAKERRRALEVLRTQGKETLNTHIPTINLAEVEGSISALQEEFRERFEQYLPADKLEDVEVRERGALCDVWALWLMFVYSGGPGGMSQPVQWATSKLDEAGRAVVDALRSRLIALSAHILSEEIQWQRGSALWLRLEVAEPLLLHESRVALLEALHATFKLNEGWSIAAHVSRTRWRHVVIVPTFRGRALARTAWRLGMDTIAQTSPAELGWWTSALWPVPESTWRRLGIALWEQPLLNWADELVASVAELGLRLDLILGLRNSISAMEIDTLGQDVLGEFVREQYELMVAAAQRIPASSNKMTGWIGALAPDSFTINPSFGIISRGLRVILDWLQGVGTDEWLKDEQMRRDLPLVFETAEGVRLAWVAAVISEGSQAP